jgi:polyisoprenoid-binding protein YceI
VRNNVRTDAGGTDVSSTIETSIVPAGTWTFDPTHSAVGFTVVYMGVAPFQGAFRAFEASFDEAGLRGTAQAASIDVDNEQLAEHLASPDFFDVASYPELSFEAGPATRDGDTVTFEGILEVKGNRAPITLSGTIADPVSDPWGNSKLGVRLTGSVDKNAVGLTWNAPLPEGGSMLADEVALEASLVFVQAAGNES